MQQYRAEPGEVLRRLQVRAPAGLIDAVEEYRRIKGWSMNRALIELLWRGLQEGRG